MLHGRVYIRNDETDGGRHGCGCGGNGVPDRLSVDQQHHTLLHHSIHLSRRARGREGGRGN